MTFVVGRRRIGKHVVCVLHAADNFNRAKRAEMLFETIVECPAFITVVTQHHINPPHVSTSNHNKIEDTFRQNRGYSTDKIEAAL